MSRYSDAIVGGIPNATDAEYASILRIVSRSSSSSREIGRLIISVSVAQTSSSLLSRLCTTCTPLSNRLYCSGTPSRLHSWHALSRSSGEISSDPRARLNRQNTSGSARIPPLLASTCGSQSASCLASCWWYSAPAVSLVTGEAIPIDSIIASISVVSASDASEGDDASPVSVVFDWRRFATEPARCSASVTISLALAMSAFMSVNAPPSVSCRCLCSWCCL
mmetsp:Transcript_4182/g.17174  ORF Transcript_4182/g.17174 Transcript_4182/m.17174 type:complete len:222 (+) Transcript_4182:858-1523(+)